MTESDMTLTFHGHPLSSYCWKVLIALYENDTAFEFSLVDFGDPDSTAAFMALWPIGKMPVLVDRDHAIFESSIIIEHLDTHHRGPVRLLPHAADPDMALKARTMDRIFDAYVMTPMQAIVADRIRPDGSHDPFAVAQARALLDRAYGWLEGELIERSWAAGEDFTLADCAAMPSLHYAQRVHPFRDRFPALAAYQDRLEARPSAKRVLAEAAPYAHLFPAA
jgi:glutathione S-transferase